MTTATSLTLKTVVGTYGHTDALRDGTVRSSLLALDHEQSAPVNRVFPRVVALIPEFDVAELAMTTYLLARAHGRKLTAIPVFVLRGFQHASIVYRVGSGINAPADLAGKRVGIRAMGQTTGVWLRGILASQYGVDLDAITWVLVEPEHVHEFHPTGNIERREGGDLQQMFEAGEIDAMVASGRQQETGTAKLLIPNALEAAARWYHDEGIYPVNHTVVVRDELLEQHPWLGPELFSLFNQAKDAYLDRLRRDGPADAADQVVVGDTAVLGRDSLAHGLGPNRPAIERLVKFTRAQGIIAEDVAIAELFAPGTLDLA